MKAAVIEDGVTIDKSIIAEGAVIGANTQLGVGEELPNKLYPNIYSFGLVTVAEKTKIPSGVKIGKNTAVEGVTLPEDYPNGILESGETLIKAGDRL